MLLNKCSILLHNFSKIFLKVYFIFVGKVDIQTGETGRSSVWWFTPQVSAKADAMQVQSQEHRQVQGPKALGHPGLLSQATSRELDGKQGLPGLELAPTWDPVTFKGKTLTTAPLRQARNMVLVMLILHPACGKYLVCWFAFVAPFSTSSG